MSHFRRMWSSKSPRPNAESASDTETDGGEKVAVPWLKLNELLRTRLEAFLIANKVRRGKLAHTAGYRIDYIRDVRLGLIVPRPHGMDALAEACTTLLGCLVTVHDLFEVEVVGREAKPLTSALSVIYLMRGKPGGGGRAGDS